MCGGGFEERGRGGPVSGKVVLGEGEIGKVSVLHEVRSRDDGNLGELGWVELEFRPGCDVDAAIRSCGGSWKGGCVEAIERKVEIVGSTEQRRRVEVEGGCY